MKLHEGHDAVEVRVAKDFGELGIFFGGVTDCEEGEMEEEGRNYQIAWSDGDGEDWDKGQYDYGTTPK